MIQIELTKRDLARLVQYIEMSISKGHFGSLEMITPEENLLLDKIKNCDGILEISLIKYKLLIEFIYEATEQGTALIIEDSIIINKFYNSLDKYFTNEPSEQDEINHILYSMNIAFDLNKDIKYINEKEDVALTDLNNKISNALNNISLRKAGKDTYDRSKAINEKEYLKEIIRKTKGRGVF